MSDISQNARLKIKRARRHIDEIARDSDPLSKDLYEVRVEANRSVAIMAKPDLYKLTYRPIQPIAEHFGAIIGDAINNMREALDYWANAAINTRRPGLKVHFPFAAEWKQLETSPNYPAIHKYFPELAVYIRDHIKPCRNTNLELWASTHLGNFNKHNDFVPTITMASINAINVKSGGAVVTNLNMTANAGYPINLVDSGHPISFDDNFTTSVELVFPKGAVFADQHVVPTLESMLKAVSDTLDALTKFIRPNLK